MQSAFYPHLVHLLGHPLDAALNVGLGLFQELILDIDQGDIVTCLGCHLSEETHASQIFH